MGNKFVDVVITRQTQAVSQKGFGLPLILSLEGAKAYKEYSGATALADVAVDFATNTKTYKLAAAILGQTPKVEKISIYGIAFTEGTTPVADLSTALNTLILTNNDWYYLTCTGQADATITELKTWINTQEKLYFASTSNKTLGATLASERTALLVHNDPTLNPAEAWVGVGAPREIGGFTWTFKTLNGITPATYSTTDISAIENANGNTYIKEGGVNLTSNGVTTSGEYIDNMQAQDYIKARMTENVFGLLVRSPKVPFTDAGIALIVAEVEKTLKDAYNNGIVADDADGNPMYTISAPTAAEVSTNDKANRTLPDVEWEVTLAGAVEKVTINGVLKL